MGKVTFPLTSAPSDSSTIYLVKENQIVNFFLLTPFYQFVSKKH